MTPEWLLMLTPYPLSIHVQSMSHMGGGAMSRLSSPIPFERSLLSRQSMTAIKYPDPKKLMSQFHSMLTLPRATTSAYALKSKWEGEVGPVEDDEWGDALDACKLVSPKLSDRLTQTFIIHRAYLTPLRVSRYRWDCPATCQMCGQDTGTFFHLLWQCPKIQAFWEQVVKFLHDTMDTTSPITLQPKPCLLDTLCG